MPLAAWSATSGVATLSSELAFPIRVVISSAHLRMGSSRKRKLSAAKPIVRSRSHGKSMRVAAYPTRIERDVKCMFHDREYQALIKIYAVADPANIDDRPT